MITLIKKILNNKVVKNFSYLTLGSTISQLIGLLTIIKITRIFTPNDYGIFTFIMGQGALLLSIGDLGIRNIIIRTIARDKLRTNDLIFNGAKLRSLAVFILTFLYILYNYFLGNLTPEQILLVFLFLLINCFSNLFETVFLGNQKMLSPSLINIAFSVIWLATVFILPTYNITISFLFYLFLIINAFKAIALFVFLKIQNLLVGENGDFWYSTKRLLSESWPYFMQTLAILPILYLSNNFLDINSTLTEIGYFNLSQKLMGPVTLIIGIALAAIFPNLSSLWAKDEKRFYLYISVGFKYFMLSALVISFLFTLFANEVVTLLFSDSYLPSVKVCQLQVWYVFLMGVNSLIGTIWGATNKEKLILKTAIINALISTPMLYYGSKFGAMGLSYGYVISFAIFEVYLWSVFKKSENIKIKGDSILWMITILLFLISYFIPHNISIIYRIIPALIVISSAVIYLLKTVKSRKI